MKEIVFVYPEDIPISPAQRLNFGGWLRQRAKDFGGPNWGERGDVGIGFVWETHRAFTNSHCSRLHRTLVRAMTSAGILSHGAEPPYRLEQRIVYSRDTSKATITLKEG